MCKAFFLGGLICLLGQVIYHYFELRNLSPDECSRWMSLSLILLSVLFTGTGIYQKLAAWGGAGALVPITGFANSVAAPAIEYKKEGQVFGIGCKIFTIAGPVILYGIFTSWGLGLIYWFGTLFEVKRSRPYIFVIRSISRTVPSSGSPGFIRHSQFPPSVDGVLIRASLPSPDNPASERCTDPPRFPLP